MFPRDRIEYSGSIQFIVIWSKYFGSTQLRDYILGGIMLNICLVQFMKRYVNFVPVFYLTAISIPFPVNLDQSER